MTEQELIRLWANKVNELEGKSDLLCEMAAICEDSNFLVWVWPTEGKNIPHFHFGDRATYGHEWRTSICIEKPEYFLHDKDIVLNGKQKKKLLEMLSQKPNGPALFKTNWEKLVWQWNEVPDAKKISYDEPMRDYRNLVVPK